MDLTRYIEPVRLLLKEIGEYQKEKQGTVKTEWKDKDDPVTIVDRESQKRLRKGLKKILPEAHFRGEESEWSTWEGLCWVVDPLDGTKAYIEDKQGWGISVGLLQNRESIFGAAYFPLEENFCWAIKGQGAFCNGTRLCVSQEQVIVVSPRLREKMRGFPFPWNIESGGIRKTVSVAQGEAGAYVSKGPTGEWDFAAGKLILEEAGGKITRFDGSPIQFRNMDPIIPDVVCSNGTMHEEVLEAVRKHL